MNKEGDRFSTKQIASSFGWKILERCSAQLVTFVVTLVLARILSPDDYGLVALITVVVSVLNIFVTSGMGDALIQKKEADNLDFSSMFWLNLVVSIILYVTLFFVSPIIAAYYEYPQLESAIKVLGLRIVVSSINIVQNAYVSKHMQFRKYFFSTLVGKVTSGVIGIVMAVYGFGYWALVAQSLSMTIAETLILWFTVKWRPSIEFSSKRVKMLYSYGWKILIYQLAESFSGQVRTLLIGKHYSTEDLAFYNKGLEMPNMVSSNIASSVSSVMFPVYSNAQDNTSILKMQLRRTIVLLSFFVVPIMAGIAVTAEPLVTALLSKKWQHCVPYLRIACVNYALWVLEVPLKVIINSTGRSGITMVVELAKAITAILLLITTINYGVHAIALGMIVCGIVSLGLYLIQVKKCIGYSICEFLIDIMPSIIISACMGMCVSLLPLLSLNGAALLLLQLLACFVVYSALSCLFKTKGYLYTIEMLRLYTHDRHYSNSSEKKN